MAKYRMITDKELGNTGRAIETYLTKKAWADFAQGYYGRTDLIFDVSTDGEYNDEGGTNYFIEGIEVTTKDGTPVHFDPTAPKCVEALKEENESMGSVDPDDLEDILTEWQADDLRELPLLDDYNHTVDLTKFANQLRLFVEVE